MRHEEFSFSADSQDFNSSWKRNVLCPAEIRAKNIYCTHGTALLRFGDFFQFQNSGLKSLLIELQNQLFLLDHRKGELEKYVFETDIEIQEQLKQELRTVDYDYGKICDQIKSIVVRGIFFEEIVPLG
ncbi:hypothetical protein SAMN04489724_0379 [Algoriphagus locisalis]|uniref:Uncharacterized protein n=2 Tax=Algoriphagus locisalis TaxID=305507 RepID=A0A1I7EA95_9BACT|nr:hypothetical protein SAMN04489724_0379 [Algoriphagus locisalis]